MVDLPRRRFTTGLCRAVSRCCRPIAPFPCAKQLQLQPSDHGRSATTHEAYRASIRRFSRHRDDQDFEGAAIPPIGLSDVLSVLTDAVWENFRFTVHIVMTIENEFRLLLSC